MPLQPGEKLGPYEIVAPLGAGGMGEVYKARDTRLERSVAIKVLPEHIGQREDARGRFEREARAVASLNHPNICTLHDIGPNYMVMELIEGETLAARIAKGPIPLEQAITLATQIADALDRAHRAGVTHRDIKPQNIMLTRDGVKVLDFGLAKSTAKPGPTEETLTQALTTQGTIVGTPQYMAPEQFEGKEADGRSDIWAFGAVLYEMVTGRKAFEGKSYSSLVGAILSADPAPMAVQPFTPAWLERLVRRCLQKDPEDRWQSMRDLVIDLRNPPMEGATATTKRNWMPWTGAAVCLTLAAGASGWALWLSQRSGPVAPAPTVTEINPPAGGRFEPLVNLGGSAISPDGRTVAYVALTSTGQRQLHVRRLDSREARAIPGTNDAGRPFWSPDSQSIGFFADGKLKRVELAGGSPAILCDARAARGGSWSEDGTILFAERNVGLVRVPASGGERALVTALKPESGEEFHYYPQFLPGGRRFLYLVRGSRRQTQGIYVGTLDGKAPAVRVLETPLQAKFDTLTQSLLYVENGVLMARRLELEPPRLVGDPRRVSEGVATFAVNGYVEFSTSVDGRLFYLPRPAGTKTQFAWYDRGGRKLQSVGDPFDGGGGDSLFRLSPDGERLVYGRTGGQNNDLWLLDLRRGTNTRLTFQGGTLPLWAPDGKHIYYVCSRGLCRKAADGGGEEETVLGVPGTIPRSISPDGSTMLVGRGDILSLRLGGGNKLQPWLQTQFGEENPTFSPDGRWVAYGSDESVRAEVYVQGYPDRRGKWQVSQEGGFLPHWRSDARELYWSARDGTVMAAPVTAGPGGIETGKPTPLFRLSGWAVSWFEPDRDGKRFLVSEPVGGTAPELPMVLVQDWPALAGVSR